MNFSGMLSSKIISSDISSLLGKLVRDGIVLENIDYIDDLTILADVSKASFNRCKKIIEETGDRLIVERKYGLWWNLLKLPKRPIMTIGVLMILVMTIFLPTKVLFISVSGNQTIPDNLILEKASLSGIYFGATRQDVRSEKVKNALLQHIPQLQWVGVNTIGCVAKISVSERSGKENRDPSNEYGNICASVDGIVCQMVTHSGTPLFKVGQAVKKGQVLISGYTDCGRFIRVCRAEGEVYASTNREMELFLPSEIIKRGEQKETITINKLQIGKNIINLSKDSGISDAMCVKMYEKKYLCLPGGFQLPVAWICERYSVYSTCRETMQTDKANRLVESTADAYLINQMIAGQIQSCQSVFEQLDGCYYMYNRYSCLEMIGVSLNKELE